MHIVSLSVMCIKYSRKINIHMVAHVSTMSFTGWIALKQAHSKNALLSIRNTK
jgi:hypothetical protein